MEIEELKSLINQYGMPTVAAGGMGYFIYFVWKFVTENINSELSEAKTTIIALIDRIRMLDNDMIRMEQKLNTSIEMQRDKTSHNKPHETTQHHSQPDTSQQPPTSGD